MKLSLFALLTCGFWAGHLYSEGMPNDQIHSNMTDVDVGKKFLKLKEKKVDPKNVFIGKVKEILHTDQYSYFLLENSPTHPKLGPVWAAAYRVSFPVGTLIRFNLVEPMTDFYSPTLKRSFKNVYFLSEYEMADK